MRTWRQFVFLFGLVLVIPAIVAADDSASRVIVEKAIERAGGDKLKAKSNGTIAKITGTVHVNGTDLTFTGSFTSLGGDRNRISLSLVYEGQTITFDSILNRNAGWLKLNDNAVEMSTQQLAEAKEATYSSWVASLWPLKDKAFQFSPFGEIEIAGRKAVGVNVTREGHRLINLFFDKETSDLVRLESTIRDEATSREISEQSTYSQFKTYDGIQYPTKITIKRDGNLYADLEITDWKVCEKADDAPFAKP